MSDTSAITAASTAAAQSGIANSFQAQENLNTEFNSFLKLLTTQVTNQDPTQPLDSTQFVEQLATFSALEQQVASNAHLEAITELLQTALGNTGEQFIGKRVTAESLSVQGAFDPMAVSAPGVETGRLVVRNLSGGIVYRGEVDSEWTWDGTTTGGSAVPPGTYRFEIETAEGSTADAAIVGRVDRIISTAQGQSVGFGEGISSADFALLG